MTSITRSCIALTAAFSFVVLIPLTFGQTTRRPISDFVKAQGTFCIPDGSGGCFLFVPPVSNFLGWSDTTFGVAVSIDYAGLANACFGNAFGTTTTGTITERTLANGGAEVTVLLFTKSALTWVVQGIDFVNGPILFGHRWNTNLTNCELDGAPPALGNAFYEIKFTNTTPGAPLPDLLQLFISPGPGQQLIEYSFHASSTGQLANGKPGTLTVVETGNIARSNVQAAVVNLRQTGP